MEPSHWQLLLGFVGGLALQFAGIVWFVSRYTYKVNLMFHDYKLKHKISDNGTVEE